MKYLIIIGAFFSVGHVLMTLKSNLDFHRTIKICKNITSKLRE